MIIRNETHFDYRKVEEITRKAFWNLQSPGCSEHYITHVIREHPDFIPDLDFVIEEQGRIIANIMYTKSKLYENDGNVKNILTFGPISVLPEYQRKGYGTAILQHSFNKAIELGYDAIVIFGNPENYVCHGFKSSKKYNIYIGDNIYPTALLVKELCAGAIPCGNWRFQESAAYNIDIDEANKFDKSFEPLEKKYEKTQELFYIYSHSQLL